MKPCKRHCYVGDKDGYASMWYEGKKVRLHRLIYVRHNNVSLEAIAGLVVMHTCDNTQCVEPEHLVLGTYKDNIADRTAKNRTSRIGRDKKPLEILLEIRNFYATGRYTYKVLGEIYKVSQKTIGNIVNREHGYSK